MPRIGSRRQRRMGEHGGIGIIAAIILGSCLILAAVVIANPDYSDQAWSLATSILHWTCWIVVIIVILIIIMIILIAIAKK